jgi:hypothetical protein
MNEVCSNSNKFLNNEKPLKSIYIPKYAGNTCYTEEKK